jgi:flagellar basal-body rod protein FlgB
MGPIQLFELASQQAQWLTARQSVVSQNVANASTPGYRTRDLPPFDQVMTDSTMKMAATNVAHFDANNTTSDTAVNASRDSSAWETSYSGNSVSIEQELLKAGEVNRSYSLNTGVVRAFNQMLMNSLKSG